MKLIQFALLVFLVAVTSADRKIDKLIIQFVQVVSFFLIGKINILSE